MCVASTPNWTPRASHSDCVPCTSFRNERQRSAEQIQREILENYYFVPVFRHAAMQAIGSRVKAAKWQDVFPTITTAYAYPWEDIELKD